MLGRLATFLHARRRAVLLVAVVGVAIAGVFGAGVAKHLSPYGAKDPATQSVQATNRYESATGRQIDPGVIALVTTGGLHRAAAERRGKSTRQLHTIRAPGSLTRYRTVRSVHGLE